MEAKQLVFTMVCHYSDEADLDAVIDAVTAVLEDDSTVRSIGVERLDAPDEEEKYQCPRCHTVDIGDDTILDHGVCYACHKAELLGEGDDPDSENGALEGLGVD